MIRGTTRLLQRSHGQRARDCPPFLHLLVVVVVVVVEGERAT
jgi:hypothetical protein